ncbi:MAG: CoA transferase [Dethiobacteria bacterium]
MGQATGGCAAITGEPDGPPMQAGPNLADSGTGIHGRARACRRPHRGRSNKRRPLQ